MNTVKMSKNFYLNEIVLILLNNLSISETMKMLSNRLFFSRKKDIVDKKLKLKDPGIITSCPIWIERSI